MNEKIRSFNDAFAQKVIEQQVKEIDRLRAEIAALKIERDKWKAAAEAHFTKSVL
jgi:uncharacterized small protein (DUF1192 family)